MLRDQGYTDPTSSLAKELGTTHSWVSKNLSVLKLGDDIRDIARQGLVRGYSTLKKISQLKGKKRQEVIQSIHDGSFKPSELLQRKRSKAKTPPIA